ncbi:extracellular solute-binding protein [Haladaptatus caseinilyticus]|uniref:extracellular solute-binding protein n=1 Tax=Haladaptatus caseinilyticus TaxID=2993314 RepID=UPI00224B0F41|nr:extracellular solute-binding protein [Haladaptatus caseinilyticus]
MSDNGVDGPDRMEVGRRSVLATTAATMIFGLAGCTSLPGTGGNKDETNNVSKSDIMGSGPLVENRPTPGGTSMDDMPNLAGKLTLYLGGGEGGLYQRLIEYIDGKYPDLEILVKTDSSASLANTIIEETKGSGSRADLFLSIDAGSLGVVADSGATVSLPRTVLKKVQPHYRGPNGSWVGIEGRARTIPYNTDKLSRSDIPDDIFALPNQQRFDGAMGWAPSYGAFQSFITAMRVLNGDKKTKAWLQGMKNQKATTYKDEFLVSNAVADGEIAAGFANHYYALRVQSQRPDAPIDLAFTKNDAGALVNVSGAEIIKGTDQKELAGNFALHLLSSEAQEFFATVTLGYPMISGVKPVGGLPPIEKLRPPEMDLSKLSNVQPTLELMREVGVL